MNCPVSQKPYSPNKGPVQPPSSSLHTGPFLGRNGYCTVVSWCHPSHRGARTSQTSSLLLMRRSSVPSSLPVVWFGVGLQRIAAYFNNTDMNSWRLKSGLHLKSSFKQRHFLDDVCTQVKVQIGPNPKVGQYFRPFFEMVRIGPSVRFQT